MRRGCEPEISILPKKLRGRTTRYRYTAGGSGRCATAAFRYTTSALNRSREHVPCHFIVYLCSIDSRKVDESVSPPRGIRACTEGGILDRRSGKPPGKRCSPSGSKTPTQRYHDDDDADADVGADAAPAAYAAPAAVGKPSHRPPCCLPYFRRN